MVCYSCVASCLTKYLPPAVAAATCCIVLTVVLVCFSRLIVVLITPHSEEGCYTTTSTSQRHPHFDAFHVLVAVDVLIDTMVLRVIVSSLNTRGLALAEFSSTSPFSTDNVAKSVLYLVTHMLQAIGDGPKKTYHMEEAWEKGKTYLCFHVYLVMDVGMLMSLCEPTEPRGHLACGDEP